MSYHKPSLKKLIREPKKGFDRLMAFPADSEMVWFSNGHWAVKLYRNLIPVELAGFLPRDNEPDGYCLEKGGGRFPKETNIDAVIPKETRPITLTQWVHTSEDKVGLNSRLGIFDDGECAFFDQSYILPLLKALWAMGSVELRSEGPTGPMVGNINEEIVLLLMPIKAEGESAEEGAAISATRRLSVETV